ncbi:MAG: hypothetical protein PHS54_02405 [Clostridia bacterium]|nr:hypothetical protein [Clostridia bacterium]
MKFRKAATNFGLASGGQTVPFEIFVIFANSSGLLSGKVLLKPARTSIFLSYGQAIKKATVPKLKHT